MNQTDQTAREHLEARLIRDAGLSPHWAKRQVDAFAYELAAVQRAHVAAHGLIYTGTVGEVIDLIDPTKGAAASAVVAPSTNRAEGGSVREHLLDALDFSYCQGLGYATPEALLAAYDASRTSVATDRAALRDRIADALAEADGWKWVTDRDKARSSTYRSYQTRADAVLAVLGEPTDRAAVLSDVERQFLTYALDLAADQMASRGDEFGAEDQAAMETLRRLAVEAQSCRWEHPHPGYRCEPRTAVEAHGTGTQQQVPQRAYPDCEHCGDTGVDPERDGAEPCLECQQTNVPAPVETDEERADREATERDHARGDHTYCGITCEIEMPTEHLRNFVIAKGYPGTRGALDELLRRARAEVAEQQAAAEAWDVPDARPGTTDYTLQQQAAAADGEETHRCAHTDIVYGRCVLPIPHDGECVHEHQPRCAMPSPDGQHSCVLPPNHEWLHADKHLAEVMPNGSRVVWETPTEAPPSA